MDFTTLTQPPALYVLIAVAVVVIAAIVWFVVSAIRRRREREALRARYGAEFDRTLAAHRSTRAAVADLKEREELHESLQLRDLNEADRDLVRRHMAALQFRFVEDPAEVMVQTDRVVTEVLRAKGYPVAQDRDSAVRLFSVDHPEHAGTVRDALAADHGGDIVRMRATFLDVRHALHEVAGVSYLLEDANNSAGDLRIERDGEPHPTTTS